MTRKQLLWTACVLLVAMPLRAEGLPEVKVAFIIDSPEVFKDSVLGPSKAEIESEVSQFLVERLGLYFPYLFWIATDGSGSTPDNRLVVKMVDRQHICEWETDLIVRAEKRGVEEEMLGVKDIKLYDLCDPMIPNRWDSQTARLLEEDRDALVGKLKQTIESFDPQPGSFAGFLRNESVRQAMHQEFLSTVPLALGLELRARNDGSMLIFVPVDFEDLKAAKTTKLKLTLAVPGAPAEGTLVLGIVGNCEDLVLCQIEEGGIPGGYQVTGVKLWEEAFGDLLSQAQSTVVTMDKYDRSPFPCATHADTSLLAEP